MSKRWLEVPEVAKRLGVHEKTVYVFIRRDGLPAARVGRKFVVGDADLELWIAARRSRDARESAEVVPALVPLDAFSLIGGDALLVESLLVTLRSRNPEVDWRRSNAAGLAALAPVAARDDVAAFVNLRKPGGLELVEPARRLLADRAVTVWQFLERPVGLAVADRLSSHLTFVELVRRGLRFAIREDGAGARVVAERLMADADPGERWRENAVIGTSHHAVGWLVAAGRADAGFCTPAVARSLNLSFLPLGWESIDCVLSRDAAASVAGRALASAVGDRGFDRAWTRAGYRRARRMPARDRGARVAGAAILLHE